MKEPPNGVSGRPGAPAAARRAKRNRQRRAAALARIRRQRQANRPPNRFTWMGLLRAIAFAGLLAAMVGVPALIPVAFKAWQTHHH